MRLNEIHLSCDLFTCLKKNNSSINVVVIQFYALLFCTTSSRIVAVLFHRHLMSNGQCKDSSTKSSKTMWNTKAILPCQPSNVEWIHSFPLMKTIGYRAASNMAASSPCHWQFLIRNKNSWTLLCDLFQTTSIILTRIKHNFLLYNVINSWISIFFLMKIPNSIIENRIRLNHYSNWLSLFVKLFVLHSLCCLSWLIQNEIDTHKKPDISQFLVQLLPRLLRVNFLSDLIDCNFSQTLHIQTNTR